MRIESRPLLVALSLIAAAIVLLGDLLIRLSGVTGSAVVGKLGEYFWADQEANLWSWYSSFLLGAAALGLFLLALRSTDRTGRRAHAILGAAALLMSADETASLHEGLGYLGDGIGGLTSHWLLLGVPLAVLAGLVALRVARNVAPVLRNRLIVAGVVYVLGAVVVEFFGGMLSGPVGLPRTDLRYIAAVTLEEGLEFTGILLACRAVLAELQRVPRVDPAVTAVPQTV